VDGRAGSGNSADNSPKTATDSRSTSARDHLLSTQDRRHLWLICPTISMSPRCLSTTAAANCSSSPLSKDAGFTPAAFVDALRAIGRPTPSDWDEDGVDVADVGRVRQLFDSYRSQLTDQP